MPQRPEYEPLSTGNSIASNYLRFETFCHLDVEKNLAASAVQLLNRQLDLGRDEFCVL